jgi:hypothetical protein
VADGELGELITFMISRLHSSRPPRRGHWQPDGLPPLSLSWRLHCHCPVAAHAQYELDGLVIMANSARRILMPLWHGVIAQSPSLAD